MKQPLKGLRVVDFTLHNAGPFCTMLLGSMGADVVKIESATRLDIHRRPHPVYGRLDIPNFEQVSMCKRSVRLNLKDPKGKELAKELVRKADLAVESFRPGVMDRLGLGYEELRQVNPRIVLLSVSAAGQTGRERNNPGYAPVFAATGGLGHLSGYSDGPPLEIRHIMDHSVGLAAFCGVMMALYHQKRTGEGQHVDLAGQEVASCLVGEYLVQQASGGGNATRIGNEDHVMAPHGVYPTATEDSWVTIAVGSDSEWQGLLTVMGHPAWAEDARFRTVAGRWENRAELDQLVAEWTVGLTSAQIVPLCQNHGVAAMASLSPKGIFEDPHVEARGMLPWIESPAYGRRQVVKPPFKFSDAKADSVNWSADFGADTHPVFREWLDLSDGQIDQLIADKVLY